jgi:hypothetical protein
MTTTILKDQWSFAAPYLEMSYNGQNLASGSSFFWKSDGRIFLVSNWHNFSGRNSETGQPNSPTGGVPSHIKFLAYSREGQPDLNGNFPMAINFIELPLYNSNMSGARWLEHPTFGRKVDVAAIDVSQFIEGFAIKCVNEIEGDAVLEAYPSQDVFIIGYPLGLIANAPAPVWKRGTVATDPNFNLDGLPMLYVDTATRKGMSGSIVIARHIVVGSAVTRKDGTQSPTFLYAREDVVLGIYSGRLGPHQIEAQLGIVWKRQVIEETVAGNRFASDL